MGPDPLYLVETERPRVHTALTFRRLADEPCPDDYIPDVVDWAYEATWPPLDWLAGESPRVARDVLASWIGRDSSEASIRRVTMLFEAGQPVGGFIALAGRDVAACRHADTRALIAAAGRARRPELSRRLRWVAELQTPLDGDAYYLSRLGVRAEHRRRGYATTLMRQYLVEGRRAGFERFRLDVARDNDAALRLYRSTGFRVEETRQARRMSTLSMVLSGGDRESAN
jgi:ribosomal protein S18 acetylase RimI-like enzyme